MSECMTQEDAMNMSTEQAIQILKPMQMMMRDQHGCPISDAYFALEKAIEALEQKVDAVERKRGEWVDDGLDAIGAMGIEYRWKKCPNCGERISKAPMQRLPNFCPNCGADMRKGEEG